MFVLRSTCFQAPFHVWAQTHIFLGSLPMCFQIYMPMCSLPCLCLDLHAYVFFAMFMLITTCLCVTLHVYAQICKLVLRSVCLCASCHACVLRSMLVAMPCVTLALFVPRYLSFLCFGLSGRVQIQILKAYIRTTRPILKGLDHFLQMSMFACILLCFISMLTSLDLSFAILCAL